ncbi:receptor-like protein 7 [Cornus florida]|uniref:receptor-like protein 7 n=1 Tax=Cornus florida TaxID=4283 RepID=UPI002899108E|nr:receptor-like protein 7 [Cornus florida]
MGLSQQCPMRILILSWFFLIPLFTILFGINTNFVSGRCLNDQRSLLVQLKKSLHFSSSFSTKLINWNQNQSTDYCGWSGVTCDNATGRVIGLDLSSESISGGVDNSSALFSFESLQSLNLANNSFNFTQIPLRNLTTLTYLNLSNAGFAGQIPMELSSMMRLVTLDLSTFSPGSGTISPLKLENPNLSRLVQNLTKLEELHLNGVKISAQGKEWCQALSSSLPNLRVLRLSNCNLSGPFDSNLSNLRNLSVIHLSENNLSTTVPDFFTNFTNLTVLRLSNCNLQGVFPDNIFQVPALQTLDLSNNQLLNGSLPEIHQYPSLQNLVLSYTNFSGRLPNSIDNFTILSRIELVNCNFSGSIPNSMSNLTHLVYLDFSSNNFTGPIPTFQKSKNLTHIDMSRNYFTGLIPSTHFDSLLNLTYIDLRYNSLNGSIPSSLLTLPSLKKVQLSFNQFGGLLNGLPNASSSILDTLDLSSNKLSGPIPTSFFELKRLIILLLSSNNFSGPINLENFARLPNLTALDLSYNSFSIDTRGSSSTLSSLPQISKLRLASCKLQSFPNLKNQSRLYELDLSDNQIRGEIPNWIWEVGNGTLAYLNLSYNLLVDVQKPYNAPMSLSVLDLRSNQLHGEIPIPPGFITYVDYSSNNFNSSIPVDIGNYLSFAYFFSLSKNSLIGAIPQSYCNATYLQVLDLSNNGLSDTIPSCLIERSSVTLGVLNLRNNKLSGNIWRTFPSNCNLKTLDLNGNNLEGQIPKSLANCTMLEVLNLGNNKINDTFPCFLKNSSSLRVLVLRSNKFQGGLICSGDSNGSWPKLQIIDLALNNFGGNLPRRCFLNWRAMMVEKDNVLPELSHLRFEFLQLNHFYYQDTVTVANKGLEMELVKILTIFTSIDLSSNNFQGRIPENARYLTSLYVLNLSRNALNGSIPASIGNLKQLESLDLSNNMLTGRIPTQLAGLTFLSFLNLSYNLLVGRIPASTQLQSFSEASFEGNEGLCGAPLSTNCRPSPSPTSVDSGSNLVREFHWQFIFPGLGFGVGAGIIVGPLMFWKQGRNWYDERIDKFVLIIVSMFGFIYTSCEDMKVEAEENIEEEPKDDSGVSDNDEDEREEKNRRRYCLFCSKLDTSRKKVIHNPKCTCHDSTLMSSFSTSSSSSSGHKSPNS